MSRDLALEALRDGAPIIVPTDTVYGLAALATDHEAVAAIFALKHRPVDVRVAALVAGIDQAETLVDLGPVGRKLAEAFWPGALTIVARRRAGVDLAVGDATTVGVRCPDDDLVRGLAADVGPIAATSANFHGEEPPTTAAELRSLFPTVAVVVDGGERAGGASTVVSIVDEEPLILREGPIGAADIDAVLHGRP